MWPSAESPRKPNQTKPNLARQNKINNFFLSGKTAAVVKTDFWQNNQNAKSLGRSY